MVINLQVWLCVGPFYELHALSVLLVLFIYFTNLAVGSVIKIDKI
jgi:hypothetical protein